MEKDFNKIIEIVSGIVEDYSFSDGNTPEQILELSRHLAGYLFYLEGIRSDIFKRAEGQKYLLINGGMAVNKAENKVNFMIPDMYKIRRVMEAGYKVLGLMISDLSWLKAEMQKTNING